ncbi:MAG: hypothetical protein U0934_18465 [Pseudotabrizicola sp.]|uniref:hypothetical protein n=1 Tax=Pseudotabrizicola sp. TaxID=2939647 RepID=UPI002719C9B7|nr:hypothetical protein [Pseudotabrizicola sp.]MDO8885062.1 hypothetical protein [Pseudotabrizicola sp.]MDP2083290.1 hypothetical protein [Pseudotabrizicola sp.]MDZ7575907.1 hypothetical protein [Pseudotabrizicola sp.]
MFTVSQVRIFATLVASATLGLAMTLANGIPPDTSAFVRTLLPMMFGAGLAQWLLFVQFARKPGMFGLGLDLALWLVLIALAGLFAGTLIMPGAGSVLGPMVTLSLPLQSPLAALIYALGAALGIGLMRRDKARALLQPSE